MQNNSNNTTEKAFLKSSAYIDFLLAVGEFTSSKFLAITTAVIAYSFCDSMIEVHLPPSYHNLARFIGIGAVYFLIDFGLTPMIRFYFKEKEALKSLPITPTAKKRKRFLSIVFYLIVFKWVTTVTSSFWATPVVAHKLQGDFKAEYYIDKLTTVDSLQAAKLNAAFSETEKLSKNEKERIKATEKKAKAVIEKAIASGDRWQKESYKREGLSWLDNRNNKDKKDKAYSKRIKEAKQKATTLLLDEADKINLAQKSYQDLQSDTTHASIIQTITNLSQSAQSSHNANLKAKKGFIYLFDFFAGIMSIFCTWLRTLRKQAAGPEKEKEKSFGIIFSKAGSSWYFGLLNHLETLLNVDLNNDRNIGTPQKSSIGFSVIKSRNFQGEKPAENEAETFSKKGAENNSFQFEFQGVSAETFNGETPENEAETFNYFQSDFQKDIESVKPENKPEKTEEEILEEFENLEISKLETNLRNWYRRRNKTSANMQKYNIGKRFLESKGVEVIEKSQTTLSFIIK